MDLGRWQSVEEIAQHLGVSKESIYRWIDRRKIPAHKIGRQWKFKIDEVDQWVKQGDAAEVARKDSSTNNNNLRA